MSEKSSDTTTKSARWAGRRDVARLAIALALIALIAGLALDNRQDVSVGWLAGDITVPLYQLFVATFGLGILVGFILRVRRHRGSHCPSRHGSRAGQA